MTLRNPPCDGFGRNIEPEAPYPMPEIDEVRMFAGRARIHATGFKFNVGVYKTPIEFRRWTGSKWEPVENPSLPTTSGR
jgi:hypothetical protein